ncbi:MAG: nicotinate (nicotinamide) nucleotide adenylyltransferase [Parachlamydiales bacterium]|nr:nicotinate (nicotinamide) nucleotide adenylyltransferase [Parachlamydiales bacterium]
MTMKTKRIGIYGGTFDPPHFGHINLAINMCEIYELDEVWFIPARISPLKKIKPLPSKHRIQMLRLAIRQIKRFKVMDCELKRRSPSYTIDTVKQLIQKYPENKFFLLLGNDHLSNFEQWKDAKELLTLAQPLVAVREEIQILPKNKVIASLLKEGLTPIPILEISAQLIRQRIKNDACCIHLVPHKVLDYIQENGLYCSK